MIDRQSAQNTDHWDKVLSVIALLSHDVPVGHRRSAVIATSSSWVFVLLPLHHLPTQDDENKVNPD